MDNSGAGAYIFAKSCGNIRKAFLGQRAQLLFEQNSLPRLWMLLFQSQPPAVSDAQLAQKIEQNAFSQLKKDFLSLISCYDKPEQILLNQFEEFEAETVKSPEAKIDVDVVHNLWASLPARKGSSNEALYNLFKTELILRNLVWMLRLRVYYEMPPKEIIENLIYVTDKAGRSDPVAGPIYKYLEISLDDYESWAKTRYKNLINPKIESEPWKIDPSWVEGRSKAKIHKMAGILFHQYPMTVDSLIGWYKLKEYELECIRTAVESLRLGVNAKDAMNAAGIFEGEHNV